VYRIRVRMRTRRRLLRWGVSVLSQLLWQAVRLLYLSLPTRLSVARCYHLGVWWAEGAHVTGRRRSGVATSNVVAKAPSFMPTNYSPLLNHFALHNYPPSKGNNLCL